jgi:hypothetical protein
MNTQSAARALGAANDLMQLMRLAEAAAVRLAQELHGLSYEHAMLIARGLARLRHRGDELEVEVENRVWREPADTTADMS